MYKILLLPGAQRDLDRFRGQTFEKLINKLKGLKDDPRPPGCQKLTAENGYRIRSGDYSIVYRIDDKARAVFVYRIKHRKDAY